MLLLLASVVPAEAVEVTYQPPRLSISADNESLDSVLRALGKQMHIQVNAPAGLNQAVTVRIVNQPVKRAFRNLLRGKNYVLQWEDGGKRLAALTLITKGTVSSPMLQPEMSIDPLYPEYEQPYVDDTTVYEDPQQFEDTQVYEEPVMTTEEKANEARMEAEMAAEEKAFNAELERSIQQDEQEQDHDQ